MYSKVTEMIEDYNAGVVPIRVNDLVITSVLSVISGWSAGEALKFDSEFFDVVVADYKVPGMNGIEFLEMIRSDDKFGNIPFILFTGAGGPGIAK